MKKDRSNTGIVKSPDVEQPPSHPLVSSEEQLHFMADVMPQKVFTVTPAGVLDYLNPQWYEYTGFTKDTFVSEVWEAIIYPDDMPMTLAAWLHTLETGENFDVEHRLRRADGAYRWHKSRATVMSDLSGNIVKWFGSSTDIHDSRLAVKREKKLTSRATTLAKQREKLLELNAAKDEFISLASHQLRTPATVVKQYLSMILDGFAGDINDRLRDMLERANASNDRQIDIVDDLLEVARVDSGKLILDKKETNITPLIQEVINEQSALLEDRKQHVSLMYSQSGISAPIDRPRIKMVLENILDNASKYSAENTQIVFSVKRKRDAVTISVIDHGVGIATKDKPKLFNKFTRLANPLSVSVGGTGLGLYWAERVVRLHGGHIDVKSKPGMGSTFTVVLPRK